MSKKNKTKSLKQPANMRSYRVWEASYYEDMDLIIPTDNQYYGEYRAKNVEDLKKQLKNKGYDPKLCRWEFDT